jgi:Flp pilus assembly protein TadD/outer membrane protein OmpA-like peptidoglycan-associated protein
MRKLILVSLVLTAMTVLFSACNSYKKMQKEVGTIEAASNPEVLVLTGNTVDADVTVTYPKKYFGKEIILKVTPVLMFEGGEIAGTAKYFQGEKVKENYTVVPNKEGGSYTFPVSLPYDERASVSTLELRIEGRYGEHKKAELREFAPFGAIAVAQGVSTVQALAHPYMSYMPHGFQRITTITEEANIHYLVNSSKVRNAQLSQEQIKLFEEFVKANKGKENVTLGNIHSKGYASPEGPEKFNDKLSADRSKTGEKALQKQLKGTDVQYDAAAYGEDWEGFKKLVEASDMADKDLILQVLAMYDSSAKRDQEIKNLSQVFTELKKTILPELRRTQFVASAEVVGYSDSELVALIRKGDTSLKAEEMLYAATLVEGKDKIAAYKLAAKQYGNDIRTHNNLGAALFDNGDVKGAKAAIEQAAKLGTANCVTNNLAVIALAEGDYAAAKQYLAATDCHNAPKNRALMAMYEKDYATAAKGLDGYNLAVVEVMNGNYTAAKKALNNEQCPYSDYLRAVIAMREGDSKGAMAYLKSSVAKNPALRDKAKKDIEFVKLFGTEEFMAL